MKKRVYVGGPFSGDQEANTHEAIRWAEQVKALGFAVFVPHLYLLWDRHSPHGYEFWMGMCLDELERSDLMFKFGDSPGADREEARMIELGRPVVRTLAWLREYR